MMLLGLFQGLGTRLVVLRSSCIESQQRGFTSLLQMALLHVSRCLPALGLRFLWLLLICALF